MLSYLHNLPNWALQPFSQDYDPVSRNTYKLWDLLFNVNSERKILRNFIYSQNFSHKSAERNMNMSRRKQNLKKNVFSLFPFCPRCLSCGFNHVNRVVLSPFYLFCSLFENIFTRYFIYFIVACFYIYT